MADALITHAGALDGESRQQLARALAEAADSPLIDEPAAALLRRAHAAAYMFVLDDLRLAGMRAKLDAALTPSGELRSDLPDRWGPDR